VTAEGRKGSFSRKVGLVTGAAGFLGTLGAPILAALPGPLRWWGGLFLAVVGTVLLVRYRGRRAVVAACTAGAALGLCLLLAGPVAGMPGPARRTLAVAVMMASWWITVAIPIPATSLLPLVLFPSSE
jgi:sodium-dependent dicarboxylate transporter 2/3/5